MMKSLLASVRAGGGLDRVDHAVQLLEEEWRKHGEVPLERLWVQQKRSLESDPDEPVILLAELIKTDLRCRFARGLTPAVADYLGRFPELNDADSRVLSLIYEEFCLREERGDAVDVDSFCDRYPRWKESLVSQLQYHHLFSQAAGVCPKSPRFPEPGDTFEEFQLVSLLGRGGAARVFLARDLSLGGKQVVLKVSMDRGREPQAQGALDHPHIVPVNSVVFDDREMRGLSMPYRPGMPLDEVIRRVDPASRPRNAMALWQALVRAPEETTPERPGDTASSRAGAVLAPAPRGDGWEGFPIRGSYAQGVAWVVKVIAEALHYAHGQQTFHRDVKPANILLTIQHGPQLLDFNLAESPHSATQAQAALHGGTLPYMAPEQIEAFLDPQLWGKVGARADVYSLGLVLRELLTGQAPELPAETLSPARAMRVLLDRRPLLDVSVRRANPAIPHALEAIVARCLAFPPEERYPEAETLADDLEQFLAHRPLAHATNPSQAERCVNWGRRNGLRLAVGTACFFAIAFLVALAMRPSNRPIRPTIPIRSSPILRDALGELDAARPLDAIEPLETLVDQYPESSIPRLALCFAQSILKKDDAAADRFREVLGLSNHIEELRSWNTEYLRLGERLKEFSDRCEDRGRAIKGSTDLDEGTRDRQSEAAFRLEEDALTLARQINATPDPGILAGQPIEPVTRPSPAAYDFKYALAEEGLGKNHAVYEQATRVLASIQSQQISGPDHFDYAAAKERASSRFKWGWLRCRVATRLADDLRKEGTEPARLKALQYMIEAEKDIQNCRHFVDSFDKGHPREAYWVEGVRTLAMLTYGELEIELDRLPSAESHLRIARRAISTYRALSYQVEGNDPQGRSMVNENLKQWERRLNDAFARVDSRRQAVSPRDEPGRLHGETVSIGPATGP